MARPEPAPEASWDQLRPVLDEELDRLPEKYRMPLVLCYLQGKSSEAAAQEMGWPKGTLLTRAAKARELFRDRLLRRGVVVTGALLGTLLLEKAGSAAVSVSVAASTVKIASLLAAGQSAAAGLMTPQVGLLFKGGLKALLLAKMKIAAALVMALGIGGSAAGVAAYHAMAPEPPPRVVETIPDALLRKASLLRPEAGAYKWRQIPWTLDLAAGLRTAREERRPLLLWGSADDPMERC